jgi:FkbH-like protein
VVLGIVSKNTESVALEAIDKHPEMVLRRSDFVGFRINWDDKARNVADLTASLRLGLQSVVFIDDNPVERARVREALPEVFVPEWPEDKLLYPSAFAALRCFDAPALSREDADRTRMYDEEQQREALRAQVSDVDEWLRSLGIRVAAQRLNGANLTRVAQLLNKTNQMNLTTRRLTEDELTTWSASAGRMVWALTVSDKLGDAGLTGILSVEASGEALRLVDFVLSCRVMGRKVEGSMLHLAVEHARSLGLERLEAHFKPTAKNKPCREWFDASGLRKEGDDLYVWKTSAAYSLPDAIRLERLP